MSTKKTIRAVSVGDYADPKDKGKVKLSNVKSTNSLKASDLYDMAMENEWPEEKPKNSSSAFADAGPQLQAEPYVSKYGTKFEPKSHYRYSVAYHDRVLDDEEGRVVQTTAAKPPSATTDPLRRKQQRPTTASSTNGADLEDGKKTFLQWVMNGQMSDMGQSEKLLFKKST